MTVRFRLALTVLLTGLATALGVIVTVIIAFDRFEHESVWQRGDMFLERVTALHEDLLEQHQRRPEEFGQFLRNLLLYEPDSQLYLLDAQGLVLASTGRALLPPGFKVALAPVLQAATASAEGNRRVAAYVMGDDPEHMDADAVVAARPLRPMAIARAESAAGYLYLVCRRPGLPASRRELLGSSLASPALAGVLIVCVLGALLGAWIITTVTRPLRVLSDDVAAAAREGFKHAAVVTASARPALADDEFGRLRGGFRMLLDTLRQQWDELQRLDRFRRESVSNLSHDLRSPLTATVACLETLEQRWRADAGRVDDRHLVEVALRNTRNAAGMVRALGDLALLDEPEFELHPMRQDLGELLDDIALRYAQRAAQQGVILHLEPSSGPAPVAPVDIELFERAVANLLDNALKFTPSGKAIRMSAECLEAGTQPSVRVCVTDEGCGIGPEDLPHLFDRLYQARDGAAQAGRHEGWGLGLAIVKRIVELHGGTVTVSSEPGRGTAVRTEWPAPAASPSAKSEATENPT
jgi:signal transduction histidine kinase